jgi:hypothetical protein
MELKDQMDQKLIEEQIPRDDPEKEMMPYKGNQNSAGRGKNSKLKTE